MFILTSSGSAIKSLKTTLKLSKIKTERMVAAISLQYIHMGFDFHMYGSFSLNFVGIDSKLNILVQNAKTRDFLEASTLPETKQDTSKSCPCSDGSLC